MTLKATNETLRVVTASAVTIDYHVNYADLTTTATDSTTEGSITTATTTTIVSAPAASTQRLITYASFVNRHASLSQTLYLTKEIAGSPTTLTPLCVLAYGEMLVFVKGEGWSKLNRNGDLILVGATGAAGADGGGGITTFVEVDDDFILENGHGYMIEDSALTGNITVDTDSLVAGDECEVYNANLTYSVSFSGATVYGFGGGSAQDSIIGGSSVKIRHIGTKIIMI